HLRRAVRVRRPRVHGTAPVETRPWSHLPWRVSEAFCAAARFRRATSRGAIRPRVSLRMRAQAGDPAERLRATLRPARVRVRTTPDGLRATPPCPQRERRNGTHPRRALWRPAAL